MSTESSRRRDRVSDVIVERVASTRGVDQLDLDPLYQEIDPDAIDRLWRGSFTGTISFEYAGCAVTMDGESGLEVRGTGTSETHPDQLSE